MEAAIADATAATPTSSSSSGSIVNSTIASLLVETSTILNNLTSTIQTELVKNLTSSSSTTVATTTDPSSIISTSSSTTGTILGINSTAINGTTTPTPLLGQAVNPGDDDDGHKNPELKYFSTVIIIFMGLTILIVPVFCFIGVVCARARVFRTVREAAGRGWGFTDADVPYAEFGSDDYSKDRPVSEGSSSRNRNCDVKILVADDNRVPSSRSPSSAKAPSFLRLQNNTTDDEDDISTLQPTFVHS